MVLGVVWVVLGVVFLAQVPAVALPLLLPVLKPRPGPPKPPPGPPKPTKTKQKKTKQNNKKSLFSSDPVGNPRIFLGNLRIS